jgi:uncharacterized protein YjdB
MKRTISKIIVLILSLLILVSCSINSVKELKFNKSTFDLEVNQTEKLNLAVEPAKATLPEIIWSSDNATVAEVDNTGLVKAVSVGKCVITAKTKDEKLSVISNVTVKPKSVKEIKLDKSSVNLEVGNSEKLNSIIVPTDAAAPEIQWISSDEKIATVDNTGVIKAVSIGTTTVTTKIKNGVLSASSNVAVKAKSVKGIKLNKTSLTLKAGSSEKLQFVLDPTDPGNKNVTYSSSNTKIATVSSNGTVKAIAQGTTDITVKSEDGDFTAKCSIKVSSSSNPKTAQPTSSTYPKIIYLNGGVHIIENKQQDDGQFGGAVISCTYIGFGVQPFGLFFKIVAGAAAYNQRVTYKATIHFEGVDRVYNGVASDNIEGVLIPSNVSITTGTTVKVDFQVTYKGKTYNFSDTAECTMRF